MKVKLQINSAEDKFFDHHREILAAKMEMENQEKAQ